MSEFDLVLVDGRLPDGAAVDVATTDGRIAQVAAAGTLTGSAKVTDQLGGALVLPSFVEPHAHVDKAMTADVIINEDCDLMGAIVAWNEAAGDPILTYESIVARASEALRRLVAHGVTAVRSHVNVTPDVARVTVPAMIEVAEAFDGLIDLQLVALTGRPMSGPESAPNREALEFSLAAGFGLVGGAPHIDIDPAGGVDHALAVATDAGVAIDLHIDETLNPDAESLLYLAKRVQETGFSHGVAASHCVSLESQDAKRQAETARQVAAAGISVNALPQTNLFLQGHGIARSKPRGITAVKVLQAAGVNVAAGADNVEDPFNPLGRSDPWETASLMVMGAHVSPEVALHQVTNAGRVALGLDEVTVSVGDFADLIVVEGSGVRQAMARAIRPRRVYRRGVLVANTESTTTALGERVV